MPVIITHTIEEKATKKLGNVMSNLPYIVETALDQAAGEIQGRMRDEAPQATGALKSSISVVPGMNMFERIIKPMVDYAFYKETRDFVPQRMPPMERIIQWANAVGYNNKFAFVLASRIRDAGYPSRPFVRLTYEWARGQMQKWFSSIPLKAKISYEAG